MSQTRLPSTRRQQQVEHIAHAIYEMTDQGELPDRDYVGTLNDRGWTVDLPSAFTNNFTRYEGVVLTDVELDRAYATAERWLDGDFTVVERGHGGYREGSGRKPILVDGIKRTFVLTSAHLGQIDVWGRAHGIDNRSAALRHLIETTVLGEGGHT